MVTILCSNKSFFIHYRSKFPEKVIIKLVARSNNFEKKFVRTCYFGSKIIVCLGILLQSIQHLPSIINNFHLLKFHKYPQRRLGDSEETFSSHLHREGWRGGGGNLIFFSILGKKEPEFSKFLNFHL